MIGREQIEQLNIVICRTAELYGMWAKRNGMSYYTMMTIYALNQLGDCTQKQICEGWLIPKQTIHTVLKELEKKGYVSFQIQETDKRERMIRFTESGRAYANAKLAGIYAIEERAMERLAEKTRQELVSSNQEFLTYFEEEVNYE